MNNMNAITTAAGVDIPLDEIRRYLAAKTWREEHVDEASPISYADPTGNAAVANIMSERTRRRPYATAAAPLRVGQLAPNWNGRR